MNVDTTQAVNISMAHEAAAVSVVINFLSAAGVAKKATIHRDGTMTNVRKL